MAANQRDEQMLKSCIGLPWNPHGYTREQIMEKFDQETREKKAATTSQLLVIPPRTEAAKAPKLPASAAAASSAGADAASAIAAASAADAAFGSATPKREKQSQPALVISPTMVRPMKRLYEKQPQVKPVPVPEATATEKCASTEATRPPTLRAHACT